MAYASATTNAPTSLAWRLLLFASVGMTVAFLVYVALRLTYPFELEWMEGAMADHSTRVARGLDLYVPPGPEHVQFLYTPLLFYLGALLVPIFGEGYLVLRIVSLVSTLVCAWLLFLWVRRVTGSGVIGFVGVGLFFGGYAYLQSWYDLARNDMLMIAPLLGAAYLLHCGSRKAAVVAGLLTVIAFLAKQTTLMWLPAIATGALLFDWRKGLLFGATATLAIGATVLGYHLATDGWFTFFVFEMPSHHGRQPYEWRFWTEDLVPIAPLVILAMACWIQYWRLGRRGEALFLAAFGSGALLTSFMSRLHQGGWDNVLVFAFTAGCVLAPIAAASFQNPRARLAGLALLALQFVLLVFDPRSLWLERPALLMGSPRFVPTEAHLQASEEVVAYLRTVDGPVMLPFHGHLATMVGKPITAHAQAIGDLVQLIAKPGEPISLESTEHLSPRALAAVFDFFEATTAAMAQKQYGAILLDRPSGAVFQNLFTVGLSSYRDAEPVPIRLGLAIQPTVGMPTHSPYVLLPK